jgi:hypothetical protein
LEAIKRDLRRRSAVEPVIGHAKGEHRMGRNFLKGAHGDAANAVLAAAGYNFRRLLAWLAILWRAIVTAMLADALDATLAPPVAPSRLRLRVTLDALQGSPADRAHGARDHAQKRPRTPPSAIARTS